jgi:hypothetical protein
MSPETEALLKRFTSGELIASLELPGDPDQVLDLLDRKQFEEPWLEAHRAVERARRSAGGPEDPAVVQASMEAFVHAFRRWKSHDLAAQIYDDVALIAEADTYSVTSPFIAALRWSYENGTFPCHDMPGSCGPEGAG